MGCLTLSSYLCLCFFRYEVGGAILTDLKSSVEWRGGQHGTVAIQLTRLKDVFHSKHYFHLEKSPSLSGFPPLPSQYFLLKFLTYVSCISPNCSVWSWKLLPWIKFKIFSFYTVNIHGFKPPRIILSLVFKRHLILEENVPSQTGQ